MNPLLAALLLAAAPARAAIGYSQFKHPRGDYAFEFPADWKRSVGLQTLTLRPPGKKGELVRLSVERLPISRAEPQSASEYLTGLTNPGSRLKKVESRATVTAAGRPAERVALVETAELTGPHGEVLPGPLREVHVVVPDGKAYYVLELSGVDPEFSKALPEFERLVAGFRLGAPGKEKP